MIYDLRLGFYDKKDDTIIITDGSPVGLWVVQVQTNENGARVIAYASKCLSTAEQRYSQTENEALTLVCTIEKFQLYLLGHEFDLITDQQVQELGSKVATI